MRCSPHVTTLRERISINGEPISEDSFNGLISDLEAVLIRAQEQEEGALSHFEVMTALAFKHFQKQQVTLLITNLPHDCHNTDKPRMSQKHFVHGTLCWLYAPGMQMAKTVSE